MLKRFMKWFREEKLQADVNEVHLLEPLFVDTPDVVVVMMLNNSEYKQAILAGYSLCTTGIECVPKFCFIDDGSLAAETKKILQDIFISCEIKSIVSFRYKDRQAGGCWERLYCIAEYSEKGHYCIELDSDTVSLGKMSEVKQAITQRQNFTIGVSPLVKGPVEFKNIVKTLDRYLVRSFFENNAWRIPNYGPHPLLNWYVEGYGGFCGFAPYGMDKLQVSAAAKRISSVVGHRINEWGSEQVAGNILVGQKQDVVCLSSYSYHTARDVYQIYKGEDELQDRAVFVHFYGPNRHDKGMYISVATRVMSSFHKMSSVSYNKREAALAKGLASMSQGEVRDSTTRAAYKAADDKFNGA